MSIRLLITIDTEQDYDTHWRKQNPMTFTSVIEGIPNLLRPIWNRTNVNPIYFVSPELLYNDDCCNVLKEEIASGAIIGAHLHPEYIEPNLGVTDFDGKPNYEFACFAHDTEIEFQKIKNLTELIIRKLNVKPEWYRAGRYGADLDTIKSLKKLGYKYDSSVTPLLDWSGIGGPDHSKAPEQPYWIDSNDYYKSTSENQSIGILEYPITISGKRFGIFGNLLPDKWLFYNWIRPSHMTVFEQKILIKKFLKKYKDPTLVMMFHSEEVMIGKSPYVRNRFMQNIFLKNIESIIRYCLSPK